MPIIRHNAMGTIPQSSQPEVFLRGTMVRYLRARPTEPGQEVQSVSRTAFFERIQTELDHGLPEDLAQPRTKRFGPLLKVFYTHERIHYEVALDSRLGHIEIGLHCEDGPATTLAFLRFFDQRIVELKHVLGPAVELERWTTSWGRIFELWPLTRLDAPTARAVGERLAVYIRTLEPLVAQAGLTSDANKLARDSAWAKSQRRRTP